MTVMAGATIAPALPEMSQAFGEVANVDLLVRLVLTIPALFIALGAPFSGLLLDRWGRKPVLISAVVLYGVAGTSGFILDSIYTILIGRAMLGLAVAGIMSGFTTLIADYFDGQAMGRFMGYQASFMGFGGVVFLLSGGVLADIGWRFPFLIYLFAFIVLPGVVLALTEPQISSASNVKSNSSTIELPWMQIGLIYGVAFVSMIIFYMVPVQLPFYLTQLTGVSNSLVGAAIAALTLSSALMSMQYQRIRARLSFQLILSLIFGLMAVGYGLISLATTYAVVLLGLLIAGVGVGLLMPNFNVWLVSLVAPSVRGRAVGGLTMSLFLGQFLSPIATQPIANQVGLGNTYGVVAIFLLMLAIGFGGLANLRPKRVIS